jgi:hypothetical protein
MDRLILDFGPNMPVNGIIEDALRVHIVAYQGESIFTNICGLNDSLQVTLFIVSNPTIVFFFSPRLPKPRQEPSLSSRRMASQPISLNSTNSMLIKEISIFRPQILFSFLDIEVDSKPRPIPDFDEAIFHYGIG